ncbi:unnamed protein product [Meloidogyne enterolobii]|uniref:Uncharacterized protein n=1 Tax=Meloidogyne enterolobii TaxID=390850 RepID=A0ACB0ZFB7_MELEN
MLEPRPRQYLPLYLDLGVTGLFALGLGFLKKTSILTYSTLKRITFKYYKEKIKWWEITRVPKIVGVVIGITPHYEHASFSSDFLRAYQDVP